MAQPIPDDRLFSTEHEWVTFKDQGARVGISDHAQCALGDVVYVELPSVGSTIEKGKAIGVVESVKAVSDIYAPLSGTVIAINQEVLDHPEKINSDCYGEGWLIEIAASNKNETEQLLNAQAYQDLLSKEAK